MESVSIERSRHVVYVYTSKCPCLDRTCLVEKPMHEKHECRAYQKTHRGGNSISFAVVMESLHIIFKRIDASHGHCNKIQMQQKSTRRMDTIIRYKCNETSTRRMHTTIRYKCNKNRRVANTMQSENIDTRA